MASLSEIRELNGEVAAFEVVTANNGNGLVVWWNERPGTLAQGSVSGDYRLTTDIILAAVRINADDLHYNRNNNETGSLIDWRAANGTLYFFVKIDGEDVIPRGPLSSDTVATDVRDAFMRIDYTEDEAATFRAVPVGSTVAIKIALNSYTNPDDDKVFIEQSTEPAVPTGGESTEEHTPTGWTRTRPGITDTNRVWEVSRDRTYTFTADAFLLATAWGNLRELMKPPTGKRASIVSGVGIGVDFGIIA